METTANSTITNSMKPPVSGPVVTSVATPESGPVFSCVTTTVWRINQTTPALYLNLTSAQWAYFNNTTNEPYFNNTMSTWYFSQSNSTYELGTGSIPITGVTYTLFGLTCCFAVLGLFGNCLILISTLKLRKRFKAHGVLITSLAICDIVALLSWAPTQPCVQDVFGMDVRAISGIVCKISFAILYPAMYGSTAIVVLICLERFLAVWYPFRTRKILSEKNMLKTVWICMTPIVLIYVSMSILYCEVRDGKCHPNFEGDAYSTVLKGKPNVTFYIASQGFIITSSMLILSIFTPLTIVKLYKQMVIRRQLTTAELNVTQFQTSVKLFAVVIAHITLLGLPSVGAILFGFLGIIPAGNTLSVLTVPLLLNHCINFLLYNIFDTEFRRNVFALFGYIKKDKKPELQMKNLNNAPLDSKAKTINNLTI